MPRSRAEGRAERAPPSRHRKASRVPGESGRFKDCGCLQSGAVDPVLDVRSLAEMQGAGSMSRIRGGAADARDLVKARVEIEAPQLPV